MSGDARVDWDDLGFVRVENVIMVPEQAAKHGSGWPVQAAGFNAREEPASELLRIERGGCAVELDVGLAVWGKEESSFIAGEEQVIELG